MIYRVCYFVLFCRRCAVEVKEQFKPYDIDLHNVPLPPIVSLKLFSENKGDSVPVHINSPDCNMYYVH